MNAFELIWNDGEDTGGVMMTDAPLSVVHEIVDKVRKEIEDYCTDDVYQMLEDKGYKCVAVSPDRIWF